MRIGYLASHYPGVSHTFILREVEALRRQEVTVETFSIHRTPPSDVLSDADRRAAATTYAVVGGNACRIVTGHARAFVEHPVRYVRTLALALRLARPGVRGRIGGALHFAEAMPLWR